MSPPSVKVAFLSLQFCFLWFLANYSTNAALVYTSVSSSTILNSTSGFFTLIIGALVAVETITFSKLVAVGVRWDSLFLQLLRPASNFFFFFFFFFFSFFFCSRFKLDRRRLGEHL